ncbi:MAG TPA: response regulator [Steroidobacteraceae bacterium]|jgi:CheY-like chemotaxis protein|nr:response regulator [Steroidobacteraceae bacterium]
MARKSALVVDDSKSARVILSRMLEKYDIEVDMAESAEQAIEYLKGNRPDAIFMDHLMPGMDGLQAVQAIKGNPQTAMIPIMMYTSQEGELYVGQARALGAMGVLPKQVRPVDVSKVLYELHLLPDRRDMAEPALQPVEIDSGIAVERPPPRPAAGATVDWGRRVEQAVKDQAVDIRRFIVASLDSFSTRIISDVRDSMPIRAGNDPIAPPPPEPRSAWPFVAGILAASVVALAFAASWVSARNELAGTRAELAGLKNTDAEVQRARLDLAATVKDLTAALAAANSNPAGAAANGAATGSAVPQRFEPVPYGEIAFDRSRLDVLRDLLTKLEAQGFRGVVKITSSSGLFCLTGNATDGYALAAPTLPVIRCDLVGNPLDEALSGQQRQSLAFANLVAGVRQRTAGAITVALESTGTAHPSTPYPARTDALTAAEWNKAAAANNRVEFSAEASAPPATSTSPATSAPPQTSAPPATP